MAKKNKQWNQISAVEDDKVKAITRRIKQKKTRNTKTQAERRRRKGERERLHPAQKVMLQLREIE